MAAVSRAARGGGTPAGAAGGGSWHAQFPSLGLSMRSVDPTGSYVKRMATSREPLLQVLPVGHGEHGLTDTDAPRSSGHIRVVCISDTHGRHMKIPEGSIPDGDILIHAGDFSDMGSIRQLKSFCEWLGTLPHLHKIVIAGNHDLSLHKEFYIKNKEAGDFRCRKQDPDACLAVMRECPHFVFLEDASVEILGYKFFGSPWQPEFCNWAFNLERGPECDAAWQKIPTETDILITHGPPLGHGDLCKPGMNRAGCVDLLAAVVERVKPLYHIFGHVHEGYGVTTNGETVFINASTCNLRYKPDHCPIVFDLPRRNAAAHVGSAGGSAGGSAPNAEEPPESSGST